MASYAVSKIRRGTTFEYSDSRMTHRLQTTMQVLATLGAKAEIVHSDQKRWDWATSRDSHMNACTLNGTGVAGCTITFPEWLTDELIDQAWQMADAMISAQGSFNRAQAFQHHEEAMADGTHPRH